MAQTKAQIRDRAANELGLLRLGQNLQSQDVTRIEQAYDEVYAYLKEKGLATWSSTASVPDKLAPYVSNMVANNCLNTYGVSNDRYTRIKAEFNLAEPKIREMVTTDDISQEPPRNF